MYYHHPAADVQPEKGSVEEATVNSFKFQICNHTSPGTKKIWFSRRLTLEMIKLCRTAARLSPVDTTPCFRFVIPSSTDINLFKREPPREGLNVGLQTAEALYCAISACCWLNPARFPCPRACRPWTRRHAFASISQRARPREDSSC